MKKFESFTREGVEIIVVDKKIKDILGGSFFDKFECDKSDDKLYYFCKDKIIYAKDLVSKFIKETEFKDLKGERGLEYITLGRLLKKFDDSRRSHLRHDVKDAVVADITRHFKSLNGGDAKVNIKK